MEKTATERRHLSLKKKLMTAVSMLLICTLMLVTATYAWFTLSTAPEVTGITTTVGANGNLEMALATTDTWGDASTIASAVGDSMDVAGKDVTLSNITWGNLVDLSATSYGLQNITLLPSRLNVEAGTIGNSVLSTPTYGADGRVMALVNNTTTGIYDADNATPGFYDGGRGVRAIGTSTALSSLQLAYRNAKADMQVKSQLAVSKARAALSANGSAIADIVVTHGTLAEGAVEGTYDISFIPAMLATLGEANAAYDAIIRDYFTAQLASGLGIANNTEAAWTAASTTLAGITTADLVLTGVTPEGGTAITLPAGSAIAKLAEVYTNNVDAVNDATAAYAAGDEVEATTASWDDVQSVLDPLVSTSGVKVNGNSVDAIKTNISSLASAIMADGILVQMPSGSGFFSNIAEVGGNYTVGITIANLAYGDFEFTNLPANMETTVASPSAPIADVIGTLGAAPSSITGANAVISDIYGYALDFFFRTNATESDLLLATEGVQRIYEDSVNAETMGQGSNMTFASDNANFSNDDVINLMKAIKIVFADGENHVLAYAKLDMGETDDGEGNMTPNYNVDGSDIKADIVLCNATITDGIITLTPKTDDNAAKITSLTKNQATKLTTYVYLDGDMVDNGDVANAATSMTGTMNLQFESNATLNPMNYTPLNQPAS